MKHLKAKLMATVMSLLMATLMLTSASFAWFTISTAPEISNIKATVEANENLEIMLDNSYEDAAGVVPAAGDNGKNTTWGNLVDLNNWFTTDGNAINLEPVKADAKTTGWEVSAPTYGYDGRIKTITAIEGATAGGTAATGAFTDYNGMYTYTANGNKVAFRVDFWLRSNMAGAVTLSTAKERGADEVGLGSTITKEAASIVKVAFLEAGSTTPVIAIADGNGVLTATVTTLTANTPKKISMLVYVDGTTATNATALLADVAMTLNVQFTMDGVDDAMPVVGTDAGRSGASHGNSNL